MPSEQLVLIVDDDPVSAMMLARVASISGRRAEVEGRFEHAIERALDPDVGLVCMSLSMKGVNGRDVYSLIRMHEWARRLSGVPMIAVAERDECEERARSLSAGSAKDLSRDPSSHQNHPIDNR
jgi:DNA-binding response OmpR family regulator